MSRVATRRQYFRRQNERSISLRLRYALRSRPYGTVRVAADGITALVLRALGQSRRRSAS